MSPPASLSISARFLIGTLAGAILVGTIALVVVVRKPQLENVATPVPKQEQHGGGCNLPAFSPHYLPWTERSDVGPADATMHENGNAIGIWFAPNSVPIGPGLQAPYLALVSEREEALVDEFDDGTPVNVQGEQGRMMWVGDPGVGEIALAWREHPGECGSFALHLLDQGLTEAQAEQELRLVAASLE
jgi:hypothetical protein